MNSYQGSGRENLQSINNYHSQMLYEPTPGGKSPRAHQGASTLDEMNHGSPVPSRKDEIRY